MPYKRRRHSRPQPASPPSSRPSSASSHRFVRRLVLFLLGAWFGAAMLTSFSVPLTFSSVDSLMLDPPKEATQMVQEMGPISVRSLLRQQVAEANRMMFSAWGWLQIGLGVLVLCLQVFALPVHKVSISLAAGMTTLAATMKFLLVPQVRGFTAADSVSGASTVPDREAYIFFLQGFLAFEAAVVIMGAFLVWQLFRRREAVPSTPVLEVHEDLLPPTR